MYITAVIAPTLPGPVVIASTIVAMILLQFDVVITRKGLLTS